MKEKDPLKRPAQRENKDMGQSKEPSAPRGPRTDPTHPKNQPRIDPDSPPPRTPGNPNPAPKVDRHREPRG